MKKILILTFLLTAAYSSQAQTTDKAVTENDPAVKTKDSLINVQIIQPARQAANGEAPDWNALKQTITKKYDAVTADRTLTKARIYCYYGKDWPSFCAGIIHYTNNFELAGDYKKLNLNAGMILRRDSNREDLKEAEKWSKTAITGDPANQAYQQTFDAIAQKLKP